jgi:hypothetical protein
MVMMPTEETLRPIPTTIKALDRNRQDGVIASSHLANNRSGFRRVVFALQRYAITRIVNHLRPCLRSCDGGYTLRLTSLS